jgi:hypothetical protein
MPKKMSRNKRRVPRVRGRPPAPAASTHSVKDLLASGRPGLKRVTDQASRAHFWSGWLAARLAPEIHGRVSGIAERGGTLVIFAESAAWSARLRYAVLGLEREIGEADSAVSGIEVRVLPRG